MKTTRIEFEYYFHSGIYPPYAGISNKPKMRASIGMSFNYYDVVLVRKIIGLLEMADNGDIKPIVESEDSWYIENSKLVDTTYYDMFSKKVWI